MTWKEYLPLAEKTLSEQFHCADIFHQKLLHAVIGSLTEIEEILQNYDGDSLITDPNKQGSVAEESADIFWYLSIFYRELKLEEQEQITKTTQLPASGYFTLIDLTKVLLSMLDSLKKKIYYNKDIDMEYFQKNVYQAHFHLVQFCNFYSTDISSILDKNIFKLKARYGDKFSSDKAINRDLETERKILENQ